MSITRIEQQREHILHNDAAAARADAEAAVIARALAEAPVGYAELTAAARAGRAATLVAGLDRPTLRLVAVRWCVESGMAWGWGQVDSLAARLERLVAELDAQIVEASEEEPPTVEDLAELDAVLDGYEPMPRPEPAPEPAALVSGPLAPTAAQLRAGLDDWASDATADGERAARAGDQAGVAWAAGRIKAIGRVRDAVAAAEAQGHTLAVGVGGELLVRGSSWYTVGRDGCSCPHGQKVAAYRAAVATAEERGEACRVRAPRGQCWHSLLWELLAVAGDVGVEERDDVAALAA